MIKADDVLKQLTDDNIITVYYKPYEEQLLALFSKNLLRLD